MYLSPIIENEPQRLAALNKYRVLEHDPDLNFEDLTLIASQICSTPMALVTIIDSDTAWFKGQIGVDLDSAPREDVFCNHAIHQAEVFEVEDTLKTRLFLKSRYVIEDLNVRFYAGAPLIDKSGYALGTLCVMDYKPRKLNEAQSKALKALAKQIMHLLDLKISKINLNNHINELQRMTRLSAVQQERMINSARLSSLGEMANGVAHEINNPLSVIDHAVEKMSRTHKFDPNSIFIIHRSIHRIARIIEGLRFYGRDGEKDPMERVNIKELLHNTVELYASRAKEDGIHLKVIGKEHLTAEARHTCIAQVLINLMQNAFQAVHVSKEKWICLHSYTEGEDIIIEVIDSGPGVDASVRDKIFEPFFTTKQSHEGTGLGLSVARRLAEINGGSLQLDPTSAQTKFVLKLKKEIKKPSRAPKKVSPGQLRLAS